MRQFGANSKGISISVSSTVSASTALPERGSSIRLVNTGDSVCYVHITKGTALATTPSGTAANSCCVVLAKQDTSLTIPNDGICNISAICSASETTTLLVYVGEGL